MADGIGIKIAGKLLGQEIKQNVNGTDLFPRLCAALSHTQHRVFLLGGQPGVPEKVRQWISDHYPAVVVCGWHHGYFSPTEEHTVIEQIADSKATLLLVAFGVPRQEKWIHRHLEATGVKVALGVGGLFDFYSGRIPRAPQWLREIGGEWLYRLCQEPQRMWKRYIVGNAMFLMRFFAIEPTGTDVTMKALIVATGYCPDNPLNTYSPALLLPLVDRPFIQHVVEFLVDQGVSEFDFILSHFPEKIEQFLGDGARWGSTFRFHLAREASQPLSVIKALPLGDAEEPILLVHADRLPQVLLAQTNPLLTKQRGPVVYYWLNQDDAPDQQPQWTGWAWLSGTALTQLASEDDNARFATRLWALGHQQEH